MKAQIKGHLVLVVLKNYFSKDDKYAEKYLSKNDYIGAIKAELKRPDTKVIATGGLGKVIFKETKNIDYYDNLLTLNGLRYIYEMNVREENE